jgi:hypothetical protein
MEARLWIQSCEVCVITEFICTYSYCKVAIKLLHNSHSETLYQSMNPEPFTLVLNTLVFKAARLEPASTKSFSPRLETL